MRNGFYSWSRSKILKSAISRLFSLTGPIGSSSTSSSSTSQSAGTFLTSVHVHSLDIPNRHQYHHLGWPIFQSLCNLSFRAQGAPLVRWGLNSHTSFSEKLALVKSCILGAKWFVVISFWPTKNWWTERRKDIKINIEIIAKATWKLEFKCQFPLSCLSIIICTTCNFLFIRCWSDTLQLTSFRAEITFPFSSSYGNPWSSNRYQWVVVVSRIAIIGIKRESGFYPEWGRSWSFRSQLQKDEHSQVVQMMFSKS